MIEQKENRRAEITCGDTFYGFSTLDAGAYPRMEIPFPGDTITVKDISGIAKRTVFAAAQESDKPQMKCVHLIFSADGMRAVSSDSFRIASAKGDTRSTGTVDMLIPAASLDKVARLVNGKDELQVGTTGKAVVFMKENFAFSARLVEGSYFDENKIIHMAKSRFTVLTDSDRLRKAMSAVYAVAREQNRFSLTFGGPMLRMSCESPCGASTVELDVVPLSGDPDGTFWYNPEKLFACFRALSGTLMLEVAQNGALLMKTDDLVCMQAQLREPKLIERTRPKTAAEIAEEQEKKRKQENAGKEAKTTKTGGTKRKKKTAAEGPMAA